MTNPNTPREQQIEELFKKGGDAAKAALSSARDACTRQAQIIIDLKGSLAGANAGSVDQATLDSWTQTVDDAVTQAGKIQKGFDEIGIPGTIEPPPIPGYTPPVGRPRPDQTLPGQPVATPYDKKR